MTSSDPIIISQNGSPKGQASPAQSLLTLPTVDPPTNSSNLEPEVTSVLNGEYTCRFSAYFDFREMRKQILDFLRKKQKMQNCEI